MRLAVLVLLSVLLTVGGADARTVVDTDLLTARADMNSNHDCTVGIDPELCAATWDRNGTADTRDDTISFNKSVNDIAIRTQPLPGRDPQTIDIQPSALSIENPLFGPINDTWKQANSSLPASVHDHVSLDSSGRPGYEFAPPTWGLSVNAATGLSDSQRVWVLCWDLSCGNVWWGFFSSNGTTISGSPSTLSTGSGAWKSHDWLETNVSGPTGLLACRRVIQELECPDWAFAPERTISGKVVNETVNATPDIQTFAGADRTSLDFGPRSLKNESANRTGTGKGYHADHPQGERPRTHESEPEGPTDRSWTQGSPPTPHKTPVSIHQISSSSARALPPSRPPPAGVAAFIASGIALGLIAGALGLYTRLRRDRALVNATRKQIYEMICQNPGIRVGTIASRLAIDAKTVSYHARMLETKFGLIKSAQNGPTQLLPIGKLTPAQEAIVTGVLASALTKSVYDHLRASGPAEVSAIAKALGRSYSTVAAAVRNLRNAHLVERRREGKRLLVSIAPGGDGPASALDLPAWGVSPRDVDG